MKEELDAERRAMERIWKGREKWQPPQSRREGAGRYRKGIGRGESFILVGANGSNVAGIWGSLEGYAGKALPPMDAMRLEGIGE